MESPYRAKLCPCNNLGPSLPLFFTTQHMAFAVKQMKIPMHVGYFVFTLIWIALGISSTLYAQILSFWWFGLRSAYTKNSSLGAKNMESSCVQSRKISQIAQRYAVYWWCGRFLLFLLLRNYKLCHKNDVFLRAVSRWTTIWRTLCFRGRAKIPLMISFDSWDNAIWSLSSPSLSIKFSYGFFFQLRVTHLSGRFTKFEIHFREIVPLGRSFATQNPHETAWSIFRPSVVSWAFTAPSCYVLVIGKVGSMVPWIGCICTAIVRFDAKEWVYSTMGNCFSKSLVTEMVNDASCV